MKITLAPPGEVAQTWDFDPSRLMVAELGAIEQVTGLSGMTAFGEALNNYSASALRALIWVLRKRSDPPLRYDAVDFAVGDISVEADEAVPKDDDEETPSSEPSVSDGSTG